MTSPPDAGRTTRESDCVLCAQLGGEILWHDELLRVVLVGDEDHPGFCRVILNAHIGEMTDLPDAQRARLMNVVFAAESALRELLSPAKINLASLGNQVPHLHWHVIPRFMHDPHYPSPVWGARGKGSACVLPERFRERLAERLRANLEPVRP